MLYPNNRAHTAITKHKRHGQAQKEDGKLSCNGQHVTRSFHGMILLLQKHKYLPQRVQKSESIGTRPLSPGGYLWGNKGIKKRSFIYL